MAKIFHGYVRKEREEQNSIAVEVQLEKLQQIASAKGMKFVENIEIGVEDDLENRPTLLALLDDLKEGDILGVENQRDMTRNIYEGLKIFNKIKEHKAILFIAGESINLDNSEDLLKFDMNNILADFDFKIETKKSIANHYEKNQLACCPNDSVVLEELIKKYEEIEKNYKEELNKMINSFPEVGLEISEDEDNELSSRFVILCNNKWENRMKLDKCKNQLFAGRYDYSYAEYESNMPDFINQTITGFIVDPKHINQRNIYINELEYIYIDEADTNYSLDVKFKNKESDKIFTSYPRSERKSGFYSMLMNTMMDSNLEM